MRVCTNVFLFVLSIFAGSVGVGAQVASNVERSSAALPVVVTDSPRSTIKTLKELHASLEASLERYVQDRSDKNFASVALIRDEIVLLIDLEEQAIATRSQAGTEVALALLDIFDHVQPIDLDEFPDALTVADQVLNYFPLRGTPLTIRKMHDGKREGEFLFSANTVVSAPRFVSLLEVGEGFDRGTSWTTRIHQVTGPWVPAFIADTVPEKLHALFLGSPTWKLVLALLVLAALILVCLLVNVALSAAARSGKISASMKRTLVAIAVLSANLLYRYIVEYQIVLVGTANSIVTLVTTLAVFASLAWVFWRLTEIAFNVYIGRSKSSRHQVDNNFTQLMFHLIGLIGATWLMAYAAQSLGLPLLSILAGLGVGGLAVALAIRPTLENLISGFVLYLEQSVKVGDYCAFGQQEGTVESIGVRSTHIRALDRTLISIPNSKFVDMELVNWAQCDEMWINEVIGLRYETDTDQLRFVLAKIRAMFFQHPRINSDTVRVRFVGYGASSLNLEIRVYAQTREWNDFYAIREDVLFRVKEIVESSGTGFAFPSQTVYLTKDSGIDADKSTASIEEVHKWRRQRKLPFPNFSAKAREELDGTLRYPPTGSPESAFTGEEAETTEEPLAAAEPLSAIEEPDMDAPIDEQPEVNPDDTGPRPDDNRKKQ